jgi:hypothetical protein
MKSERPNPINEILPADVTQYANTNHTFLGCEQRSITCVFCLQSNGIFVSIKIDTALRKCECQPLIHLNCFRRFTNGRPHGDELKMPCFGCNGPTRIRTSDDVILTVIYNLNIGDDEEMNLLFEKWREMYINFGNPFVDDLHLLEQASRLHSEEQKLKRALIKVRQTRKILHLRSGQTRAKLRKAAKCYDKLSTDEQDAIVTKKLTAQIEAN